MENYLIETLEVEGAGNEHLTHHVITADNRQMVKYHFHRTLKDWGYTDSQFDKHCLKSANHLFTELVGIKPLSSLEYDVMSDYLPTWSKV